MSSLLLSGFRSLIHHSHFHRRYFCNSVNFNLNSGYLNDPQLLSEYVIEQSKLGFHNLEFPLSLFRQLMCLPRRPSIIDFTRLFAAMVKLKRLRPHSVVVSLSRELEFSGVQPDLYSNTIVANCFCHLGRVELGFSLLGKSLKLGYPVESDIVFFTTIINGYILSDEPRQAVKLLDKVGVKLGIEHDLVTYNVVIKGLCGVGDNDGALRLLRQMSFRHSFSKVTRNGVKPDAFTYGSLLDGLCKSGQLDEAAAVFKEMQCNGVAPNIVIYTILIDSLCEAGRFKEAQNLFCSFPTRGCLPDTITYNTMIKWLCRMGDMSKAMVLLNKMERDGCAPNSVTYSTIIKGFIFNGDFMNAQRYQDIMLNKGFDAHNHTNTVSPVVELLQKF